MPQFAATMQNSFKGYNATNLQPLTIEWRMTYVTTTNCKYNLKKIGTVNSAHISTEYMRQDTAFYFY